MFEVTVEVTEDDIKNGIKGNANYCPIARAVRRSMPDVCMVAVDGEVTIDQNSVNYKADLSKEGNDFIDMFDKGEIVSPLTLQLRFESACDSCGSTEHDTDSCEPWED